MMKADEILDRAAETIIQRGTERDQAGGERSMARIVAAFNAITGHQLTEREGWLFMIQLKAVRACTGSAIRDDDHIDGAAYFALMGERRNDG